MRLSAYMEKKKLQKVIAFGSLHFSYVLGVNTFRVLSVKKSKKPPETT